MGADNNGQVAQRNKGEMKTEVWENAPLETKRIMEIGPCYLGKCNEGHLKITNAMPKPKREDRGRLVTWMGGGGGAKRKSGHLIIISGMRRNRLNKTRVKGRVDINQMYQHWVIRIEGKWNSEDTGGRVGRRRVEFDISEVRGARRGYNWQKK